MQPHSPAFNRALAGLLGLSASLACAQTPQDYLQRFDQDGNGRISLSEYQDYLSQGFHSMDQNGDGLLSAEEMPAGVQRRGARSLEAHRHALARMFDHLDRNNDGFLDADELTAPY